jgi:thioredoxin-dependent peroxiredoxin
MFDKIKNLMGSTHLKKGDLAPAFSLLDQDAQPRKLSDFAGQWLVLYFYPKDNTAGCTLEACSFRDDFEAFRELKTQIVGISVDGIESHKAFAQKHQLNFPLLADTAKTVSKDYGVLMPLGFSSRVTFLIDPTGTIRDIIEWARWSNYGETVRRRLAPLRQDVDL